MPKVQLASLAVIALAATAAANAQGAEAPVFEGLVEVSEVLIDVLATDEDGQVVLGLDKDDFIVEEDGREVELASVSYYTTRYGDAGAEPGETPSSRYLVLFFHDTVFAGGFKPRLIRQQLLAGRESQDWVATELKGSDWVAVASYDYKLKVHQDFTQDRDAILFAIELAISRKDPEKDSPPQRLPPAGVPSIRRQLPAGKALRKATRSVHDALRLLAESTGYIVGRKNLLLFTFGFSRSSTPSQGWRSRDYEEMEAALNDHNVAVYPIHLGGVGVGQPYSWVLAGLAEETGGVYYENVREFTEPLATISEENYGYYVLSYQSEHPAGEIGYERIEVRCRDDSIRIRSRRGYRYGL